MLNNILKAIPAIPEFVLTISVLMSLLVGAFRKKSAAILNFFTIAGGLVFLSVLLILSTKSEQFFWHSLFVHSVYVGWAKIILYITTVFAIFCFFSLSEEYNLKDYEWLIIAAFIVVGGSSAISSNHFLTLFIGIELSNLGQYLLVAANKDNVYSSEAAVKFFTLGAISSALMLFGISLIYGFTGTNAFNSLYYFFESNIYNFEHAGAIVGMFLVVMGLCFKFPVAPFHAWAPDVYQASPTSVLVFLSTVPKIITTFVLLHLLTYPFHGIFTYLRYLFVVLAILSMVWGAFAALQQTNIKRMFAYSAIGNMGFLLMGPAMGSESGIESVTIYLIIYTINMLGALALLSIFEKKIKPIENIADLAGIMQSAPMLGGLFSLFIMSLAGLPPFPGFFVKAYILLGVINRSAYILAIIAAVTTVISSAYYLNVLRHLILYQAGTKVISAIHSRKYALEIMTFLVFIVSIVICGILPDLIFEPSRAMGASALFNR